MDVLVNLANQAYIKNMPGHHRIRIDAPYREGLDTLSREVDEINSGLQQQIVGEASKDASEQAVSLFTINIAKKIALVTSAVLHRAVHFE